MIVGGSSTALRTALTTVAILAFVLLLAPVVIVVLAGLNAGDYLTFPPQGLSLRWVVAFFQSSTFLNAYLFSFGLAFLATLISAVLGTAAAIAIDRGRFPGRNALRALFAMPLVLPGIVIGLSLNVFYLAADIGLARTLAGLLVGHVLVTLPYVIGTVGAALAGFDTSYEDASRSHGATPVQTWLRVTLPNIRTGIVSGSIFAFIVSFGQFDVSLFLSTPNYEPLPMAMYVSLRYKFEPIAAAAGIFAIVLVILSTLLSTRFVNLKRLARASAP